MRHHLGFICLLHITVHITDAFSKVLRFSTCIPIISVYKLQYSCTSWTRAAGADVFIFKIHTRVMLHQPMLSMLRCIIALMHSLNSKGSVSTGAHSSAPQQGVHYLLLPKMTKLAPLDL